MKTSAARAAREAYEHATWKYANEKYKQSRPSLLFDAGELGICLLEWSSSSAGKWRNVWFDRLHFLPNEEINMADTPQADPPLRLVSLLAMRPASTRQECYYCNQPIGGQHNADCVLLSKKVKVRMTVDYEVEVPNHWTKEDVEFHRNESSWCSDSAIDELKALSESQGCLCEVMHFDYLCDTSGEVVWHNA